MSEGEGESLYTLSKYRQKCSHWLHLKHSGSTCSFQLKIKAGKWRKVTNFFSPVTVSTVLEHRAAQFASWRFLFNETHYRFNTRCQIFNERWLQRTASHNFDVNQALFKDVICSQDHITGSQHFTAVKTQHHLHISSPPPVPKKHWGSVPGPNTEQTQCMQMILMKRQLTAEVVETRQGVSEQLYAAAAHRYRSAAWQGHDGCLWSVHHLTPDYCSAV